MINTNINEVIEFESNICWHEDFQSAYDSIEKLISYQGRKSKAKLLKAPPGAGKTLLANTVVEKLTSIDEDTGAKVKHAICINVALYNSPSQLLSAILVELNDINPYKGTQDQKAKTVIRLFKEKGIVILVVDEFHDILPKSRILPTSKIYRFLKGFMDSCGVPFLLLGTEDSERFLEVDKQISTRFLPTEELYAFNCLSEYNSIHFALIIESLLEKFPREINCLKLTQVDTDEDGIEKVRLKESHNMLYRFNLATSGLMRVIVNLLSECIEITAPDEIVDKKVLEKAFDNVVHTTYSFNPFDMTNTASRVKSRLAKEGLYNAK
tara:strand:- start:2048 stop:3019 length:972 start_codon:yes stop_codon:yes gene_type:complete